MVEKRRRKSVAIFMNQKPRCMRAPNLRSSDGAQPGSQGTDGRRERDGTFRSNGSGSSNSR